MNASSIHAPYTGVPVYPPCVPTPCMDASALMPGPGVRNGTGKLGHLDACPSCSLLPGTEVPFRICMCKEFPRPPSHASLLAPRRILFRLEGHVFAPFSVQPRTPTTPTTTNPMATNPYTVPHTGITPSAGCACRCNKLFHGRYPPPPSPPPTPRAVCLVCCWAWGLPPPSRGPSLRLPSCRRAPTAWQPEWWVNRSGGFGQLVRSRYREHARACAMGGRTVTYRLAAGVVGE